MNTDHTYVTATCNLDSPKAWWEKTVTKWIVWWTMVNDSFDKSTFTSRRLPEALVCLSFLFLQKNSKTPRIWWVHVWDEVNLAEQCLFCRSHSWWVSRNFGMWISSSLYNRYGSCSQPASKLDAEINLERPRKHPQSLWGLASSFFPPPRVGQTPKVTNHDSMEAASPEKMTENEGILLAVWRTPVPQLFVTWEWTGAMEKWSHDDWEWQTRWGFDALEISWS